MSSLAAADPARTTRSVVPLAAADHAPHALTIERRCQGWQIRGLPRDSACLFAELADALAFAKQGCDGEAAILTVFHDGQYIVTAVQEQGWPLQLCQSAGFSADAFDSSLPAPQSGKFRQSLGRLRQRIAPSRPEWLYGRVVVSPTSRLAGRNFVPKQ